MDEAASVQDFAEGRLLLHVAKDVATLEINQPARRNAMSRGMWEALPAIVEAIEADQAVRVVLLRGHGGIFCAGADISEFAEAYADAATARDYNIIIRRAQAMLRDIRRPTIAVIEGACVGGGCGLALACDFRFAADTARFAITPAKLGLAYSFADTAQLVEKVGAANAKDILFSGRALDAGEALAFGLVNRLIAEAQLEAAVRDYAATLSAMSLNSILVAKATVNAMTAMQPSPELEAMFDATFESEDFKEGYGAFLEKRTPQFR